MAHRIKSGLLAALACSLLTTGAYPSGGAMADEQFAEVQSQIEKLLAENEMMRAEIDELKAANSSTWLTEQRAEEIRALVDDVLADSDSRAGHLQNGLMAGWSEHFFLASPDGRFKLQLQGEMQIRWVYSYHDAPDKHRQGFENTRTKLTFRGHVFNPDLTYLIRGLFAREGGFGLLDSWVQYRLNSDWLVRIGQFKLPYNREELVQSSRQLAVERSLVNESLNLGRSQGIMATYAADTWKFSIATSDGAEDNIGGFGSIAGTTGGNTPALNEDVEWSLTGRYELLISGEWAQFEDFTSPPDEDFGMLLGIAGHMQRNEFTGTQTLGVRDENDWYACTLDLSAEWGGANAFGAFYFSYNDNADFGQFYIYSFVFQGGVYFTKKLEAFARYQYGWWDFQQDFADLHTVEFGINYYLDGHDLKWTTDIGFGIGRVESPWDSDIAGWRVDPNHSEPQIVFKTQFQLLF